MEEEAASTRLGSPEPLLRRSLAMRENRVATLFSRASGRRGPAVVVRETAARQLGERRAEWAYSRPVVAVDISWNLAFAVVSVSMLVVTVTERPNVPLRVWIAGYALQCIFHVVMVWSEYRRRRGADREAEGVAVAGAGDFSLVDSGEDSDDSGVARQSQATSFAKRCESLNTMASFLWWIVGFYWLTSGGEDLLLNAPRLYWYPEGPTLGCRVASGGLASLRGSFRADRRRRAGSGRRSGLAAVFLAFDVCFAICFVALAIVIGIALCCCLPCIIAILYAVAGQEGASDADISLLQRYRYASSNDNGETKPEMGVMIPVTNNSGSPEERVISYQYAECCICLTSYEDGDELCGLPCNHHFHSPCIAKWLKLNATCPLCKHNILKSNDCIC